MKILIFISVTIMSLTASLSHADVKSISLDEAIKMALGENLQVKATEKEAEAAEARLNRTQSYFFPKVGAESRYELIDSSFQRQSGATANIFLEWNLYNGSRDWFDRKAKSIERDQAQIARNKQKLITKTDVEAKFHKLLAQIESIKSYDDSLKRNEVQKEAAKRRRSAGLSTDADVLEFDLYHSELQAEMTKVEGELKQAQSELRELLGQKDSEIEYVPQGKLIHYHVDETLLDLKKRLQVESQTLSAARYAVEQAEANKKVALGGYLPQLNITASYGSRGINDTQVAPETMLVGTARWEFFSGFDTVHAQHESTAITEKAKSELQFAELSMNAQLETAFARLKAIQDRVDIETNNKAKAQKFFDTVAAEYKRGVKNSTDMRSASQTLLEVNLRDIQYRAEFFEQKALLEKALGGEIKISRGSLSGHTD